jgi:hypothetical protein
LDADAFELEERRCNFGLRGLYDRIMTEVKIKDRFSDEGELVYDFGDEFLVVCPKCSSPAKVRREEIGSEKLNDLLFAPRRLVCLNCPHCDLWCAGTAYVGGSADWYFRLPLWLQISCCGETLWAYNEKHLDFIENYVGAELRERAPNSNRSLASRLPQWIKSAKNRDAILKATKKLKEKLSVGS